MTTAQTHYNFNFKVVDPSWHDCLERGLAAVDAAYLRKLSHSHHWLPGPEKVFNAFSLPLDQVNYVLFGESPYPRRDSANGYAFWDATVKELWSPSGLSTQVNRATSLRNLIKMLLVAEGDLTPNNTTQEAIAKLNKKRFVQTNTQFFNNLIAHGFLLLNTTLVLQLHTSQKQKDAKAWYPFLTQLLECLLENRSKAKFILFGRIAQTIDTLITHPHFKLYAEHPYNHTFISNPEVLNFFRPLHLLIK